MTAVNGLFPRCGSHLETQSIMGRPGCKTKTKMAETRHTKERLKTWTVPQLSRYLKDRGVEVGADGGRKDQLIGDDDRIVSHDAFFQKHYPISQTWQISS